MKDFLKNNPTLALGLGLPMLMVIVFICAAGIPNLWATAPQYDVIFATNYYPYGGNEGLQINVVNGRVAANFVTDCNYCQTPEIYRYNVASGSLKRISLNLPAEARRPLAPYNNGVQTVEPPQRRVIPIAIPELEGVKLNDYNPAPDGYEFAYDENYTSAGLLPELFFSSRGAYDNGPVLKKGTNRVRLPLPKNYYNSANVRFIGWVVAQ